jgi:hypothetical protein
MSALRRPLFALVACLALPLSATSAEKDTATVEGKVVFEGEPVAKGTVSFHPAKGKPVTVTTLADGTYSAKGVPTGKLVVTVEAKGIPRQFASKDTTPLRVTVKGGKNLIDFELKK